MSKPHGGRFQFCVREILLKVLLPLLSVLSSQNFRDVRPPKMNDFQFSLFFPLIFPIIFSEGFTYFSSFYQFASRTFCLQLFLLEYRISSLFSEDFIVLKFFFSSLHHLDIFRGVWFQVCIILEAFFKYRLTLDLPFFFLVFLAFLGPLLRHMEVPRLGV